VGEGLYKRITGTREMVHSGNTEKNRLTDSGVQSGTSNVGGKKKLTRDTVDVMWNPE